MKADSTFFLLSLFGRFSAAARAGYIHKFSVHPLQDLRNCEDIHQNNQENQAQEGWHIETLPAVKNKGTTVNQILASQSLAKNLCMNVSFIFAYCKNPTQVVGNIVNRIQNIKIAAQLVLEIGVENSGLFNNFVRTGRCLLVGGDCVIIENM